jgi:hypothetical protein
MGLVVYCRLSFIRQEPIFSLPDKSWEMKMNWIFETYSNVYATAMGQGPVHHNSRGLTAEQRRVAERIRVKRDV